MTYRGLHLPATVRIFILVVAVGLVGRYFYDQTQVVGPLEAELKQAQGISAVRLERLAGGKMVAFLELAPEAALRETWRQVRQIVSGYGANVVVHVQDQASPKLRSLFERISIAAEEAVMTGEFTLLEERVSSLAGAQSVDWDLSVDRDFIYVSLRDESSALQRVISRAPGGEGGAWG